MAISVTQTNSSSNPGAGTVSLTTNANIAAGSTILVSLQQASSTGPAAPSLSVGGVSQGTMTSVGQGETSGTANQGIFMWYIAPSASGATASITGLSATGAYYCTIIEIGGMAVPQLLNDTTNSPFIYGQPGATATNPAYCLGVSRTPNTAPCIIIGSVLFGNNTSSSSPGTNFTQATRQANISGMEQLTEYWIQAAAQSTTVPFTNNATAAWTSYCVGFVAGSTAPGTVNQTLSHPTPLQDQIAATSSGTITSWQLSQATTNTKGPVIQTVTTSATSETFTTVNRAITNNSNNSGYTVSANGYWYVSAAINAGQETDSATLNSPAYAVPTTPTISLSGPNDTIVTTTSTVGTGTSITSYNLYSGTSSGFAPNLGSPVATITSAGSFPVQTPGNDVWYKVVTVDNNGIYSATSNTIASHNRTQNQTITMSDMVTGLQSVSRITLDNISAIGSLVNSALFYGRNPLDVVNTIDSEVNKSILARQSNDIVQVVDSFFKNPIMITPATENIFSWSTGGTSTTYGGLTGFMFAGRIIPGGAFFGTSGLFTFNDFVSMVKGSAYLRSITPEILAVIDTVNSIRSYGRATIQTIADLDLVSRLLVLLRSLNTETINNSATASIIKGVIRNPTPETIANIDTVNRTTATLRNIGESILARDITLTIQNINSLKFIETIINSSSATGIRGIVRNPVVEIMTVVTTLQSSAITQRTAVGVIATLDTVNRIAIGSRFVSGAILSIGDQLLRSNVFNKFIIVADALPKFIDLPVKNFLEVAELLPIIGEAIHLTVSQAHYIGVHDWLPATLDFFIHFMNHQIVVVQRVLTSGGQENVGPAEVLPESDSPTLTKTGP